MSEEIVCIDGEIIAGWTPEKKTFDYSVRNTLEVRRRTTLPLIPEGLLLKMRLPTTGFYVPHDVNIVITPHISENTGTEARLGLRDSRDMKLDRYLYQSKVFNLGKGMSLTGTQLPFCLPMGEYPIQLELMVSQSAFLEKSKICTISCKWSLTWSQAPFCRVQSAFKSNEIAMVKNRKTQYLLESSEETPTDVPHGGGSQGTVVRSKAGNLGMRSYPKNKRGSPTPTITEVVG